MARRFFSLTFVVLSLTAMSFNLGFSADKLRFGSSVKGTPTYDLPMYAAEEKGVWKENGVEVEWTPFRAGGDLVRAMAARSIDMGTTGAGTSMLAASQGLPLIIVADPKEPSTFHFYVLRDSPIKEPKDLKGTKIGILRFGGTSHNYGRAVARALRLEPDIKFVAGGSTVGEVAAMKAGALDGRIGSFYSEAPLVVRGELRSALAVKEHLPREWLEQVATAHREVIEKSPDLLRRGVRGFLQAGDYIAKDKAWALAKMKTAMGYSEEEAVAIYPLVSYSREGGRISKRAVENARSFFIEYGVISKDKAPPVEELFTARFVE